MASSARGVVLEAWLILVRTLDRPTLDRFTRERWRAWDPGALERLMAATLSRREELARGRG